MFMIHQRRETLCSYVNQSVLWYENKEWKSRGSWIVWLPKPNQTKRYGLENPIEDGSWHNKHIKTQSFSK